VININGQTVTPNPTAFGVGVSDIDLNSERTTSGLMVRERVAVKRKITLGWDVLTRAEMATILQLVSTVFFQVDYDDPETGVKKTGTFYSGDRQAEGLDYKDGEIIWRQLKFNLVER
jgi:hypothetical protein